MKTILVLAAQVVFATSANAAPNMAFATSTSGNGDLGTWADSGGKMGLEAGDAICKARAAAAGLSNPDQFGAWLSDASNDAYCRVFSLPSSGTVANACGLPNLPTGAGPWARTDGLPFASTIEVALNNVPGLPFSANQGVVFSPMLLDEYGDELPASSLLFTATKGDGTYNASNGQGDCSGWTGADSSVVGNGNGTRTTRGWTDSGFMKCSVTAGFSAHLICMQKDAGEALSGFSHTGSRLAFVTGFDTQTGDLSQAPAALAAGTVGIEAGDSICQAIARDVGHFYQPGSYKALLTSSGSGNVMDRFQFDGPWYRPDGLLVAHSKAEIVSNVLSVPANVDEVSGYWGSAVIRTGANSDGSPSGKDCNGWTSENAALTGTAGVANASFGWMNGSGPVSCSFPNARLLCLSDADVIFHDTF